MSTSFTSRLSKMLMAKSLSKIIGSRDRSTKQVKPSGQGRATVEGPRRPEEEEEESRGKADSHVKSSLEIAEREGDDSSGEEVKEETDKLCCDKCDGEHLTESCPYFKKERENHPDARKRKSKIGGVSSLPGDHFTSARIIRQPGDGSCLFHSLCFGLKDGSTAAALRTKIGRFIRENPDYEISGIMVSVRPHFVS